MLDDVILEKINESEKVLIGIGEEFERIEFLNEQEEFVKTMNLLVDYDRIDLKPLLTDIYLEKDDKLKSALRNLYQIVKDKDYYLISTCQTEMFENIGFDAGRVVTPCVNMKLLQCENACDNSLRTMDLNEKDMICQGLKKGEIVEIGTCEACGKKMILNSLYAEKYNEKGYAESWENYRKWLQTTVNKKLTILELGVNLGFPSVIRFPFEKVAFYNQKSCFIRVNEKLYQLSQDLQGKGIPVEKNAIDWLL